MYGSVGLLKLSKIGGKSKHYDYADYQSKIHVATSFKNLWKL
jgi:hypothetical protein